MQLRGSWTAIITPFNQKGGIDSKALERLVDWQISEGTDGLVCCGSTGEGTCLSDRERKRVVEICVAVASQRVPVFVGTGTNDTRQSVKHTESALKQGADGCMIVTPYYNRPTQKGCILHCREVAKVGLPVIVYMNPPRTAFKLSVETAEALSQIPNIVALKDSNHDLELFKKMKPFLPIFSGDDDFTFALIREGAVGSIGVIANLIPRGWRRMVDLCLRGQWEAGKAVFEKYLPLCKAVFLEVNPQGIKFAVSWMGRCKGVFHLPLILPEEKVQKEIERAILRLSLPHFSKSPLTLLNNFFK